MAEVFLGDVELAFEPILLEAEDEVLSEAGFRFDELAEL